MYALHCFIDIPSMVNNTPGIDSPLGELSTRSKTFTRELGFYSNNTYPDVKLTSFSSLIDGYKTPVPVIYRDLILQIAQYLYTKSVDGVLTDNTDAARQNLNSAFSAQIEIVSMSAMVSNGTYWLPGGLVFRRLGDDDNLVKVWFSNETFRRQYELYEIVVVPPVDNLDDLHRHRAFVLALLRAITIPDHLRKAQRAADGKPYTYIISNNYDWVDPNDPQIRQPTPWTVLIYGEAGNNADIIRDTLIDYVLDNSEYTREQWEVIYPDLFLPNEYYITPFWDRFSLPNQRLAAGLYSPTSKYREHLNYGTSTFHGVPVEHIRQEMTVSGTTYKGLSFLACSNHKNRDPRKSFDRLWPQYIDITTNSLDFNRIPPDTQNFIRRLIEAFVIADRIDDMVDMPEGMSRVRRGRNDYLTFNYDTMQYLISLKHNPVYSYDEDDDIEPVVNYVMVITVGLEPDSGVIAQVYERLGSAVNPLPPGTLVRWDARWYNEANTLLRENTIVSGAPEELIFTDTWDQNTVGFIDATATIMFPGADPVVVQGSQQLLVLIPNQNLQGLYLDPDDPTNLT